MAEEVTRYVPRTLSLAEIHGEMAKVAHEDQAPVVVDRLQFLGWVVSLDVLTGSPEPIVPEIPAIPGVTREIQRGQ